MSVFVDILLSLLGLYNDLKLQQQAKVALRELGGDPVEIVLVTALTKVRRLVPGATAEPSPRQ